MDKLEEFFAAPMEDLLVESSVPKLCTKQPVMLGIDEAGRGPVLGPMVYGVAYYPLSKAKEMKKMEFADSKVLTEAKRDEIFAKLGTSECIDLGYICKVLSPVTISNGAFRRSKYNLNALSHDTAIQLIKEVLAKGIDVVEVYVDTVGPNDKYQEKLKQIFPNISKIVVAKKADSLYPVVSAASICAKVIRDKVVNCWRFLEKVDIGGDGTYGSGYPADPATKKFLKSNLDTVFGFPNLVRFSWSTITTILDEKGVIECEWEEIDEEEEAAAAASGPPITSFFKAANGTSAKNKRKLHKFFDERSLSKVSKLDLIK